VLLIMHMWIGRLEIFSTLVFLVSTAIAFASLFSRD